MWTSWMNCHSTHTRWSHRFQSAVAVSCHWRDCCSNSGRSSSNLSSRQCILWANTTKAYHPNQTNGPHLCCLKFLVGDLLSQDHLLQPTRQHLCYYWPCFLPLTAVELFGSQLVRSQGLFSFHRPQTPGMVCELASKIDGQITRFLSHTKKRIDPFQCEQQPCIDLDTCQWCLHRSHSLAFSNTVSYLSPLPSLAPLPRFWIHTVKEHWIPSLVSSGYESLLRALPICSLTFDR